jgi:hypothetical protein
MEVKLIKTVTDNYILADTTKEFHGEGYLLGATTVSDAPKLSKQNCDEIFWGLYDTEIEVEIVMERYPGLSLCAASPELDSEGCLILKKI